jgi:carboxymethylenebutenolidase
MVNYLATRLGNDLAAGVAFYGSAPDLADVAKIKAPLLIQSAEQDDRINASWPDYEKALQAAKVKYERFLYPVRSTGSTTTPRPGTTRRRPSSPGSGTLAFFEKHLR